MQVSTPFDSTTEDLVHPDDAKYIWLPIAVLTGIVGLAALVYAMSRSRPCPWSACCKRKKPVRLGYINVEEDSDVSMACGDDFHGEESATACLLTGQLQIEERPPQYYQTTLNINSTNDDARDSEGLI